MYRLKLRQPLFLRIYHWLLTLLVVIIVPTGFYIHSPLHSLQINFGRMFSIHVFAGFCLSYLLMVRAYYALFRQDYKSVVFTWQDLKELPSMFKYYLFFQAEKPPEKKYNSGQRLIYTGWFIFLSLADISGALAYKKTHFLAIAKLAGGLHHLDWVTLGASLFLAFTVPLHIYLSFAENNNFLQAMVTGYSYELQPGESPPHVPDQDKTRTKLPGLWLLNKFKALFR